MMDADTPRNFDPMNEKDLAESLAFENDDLIKRTAELVATAEKWAKVEKITTAEMAKDLSDFLSQISGICKENGGIATTRKDAKKKPYDLCAKVVQNFFKGRVIDVLNPYRVSLLAKANEFINAVKAEKAQEAARLADEAKAKAAAAQTPDDIKAAAALQKKSDAMAKGTGVKSDFGSSLHQTSRWDFTVVDIKLVPPAYLEVNRSAVMATIRTGTEKDPVKIPGIKVERVTQAVGT